MIEKTINLIINRQPFTMIDLTLKLFPTEPDKYQDVYIFIKKNQINILKYYDSKEIEITIKDTFNNKTIVIPQTLYYPWEYNINSYPTHISFKNADYIKDYDYEVKYSKTEYTDDDVPVKRVKVDRQQNFYDLGSFEEEKDEAPKKKEVKKVKEPIKPKIVTPKESTFSEQESFFSTKNSLVKMIFNENISLDDFEKEEGFQSVVQEDVLPSIKEDVEVTLPSIKERVTFVVPPFVKEKVEVVPPSIKEEFEEKIIKPLLPTNFMKEMAYLSTIQNPDIDELQKLEQELKENPIDQIDLLTDIDLIEIDPILQIEIEPITDMPIEIESTDTSIETNSIIEKNIHSVEVKSIKPIDPDITEPLIFNKLNITPNLLKAILQTNNWDIIEDDYFFYTQHNIKFPKKNTIEFVIYFQKIFFQLLELTKKPVKEMFELTSLKPKIIKIQEKPLFSKNCNFAKDSGVIIRKKLLAQYGFNYVQFNLLIYNDTIVLEETANGIMKHYEKGLRINKLFLDFINFEEQIYIEFFINKIKLIVSRTSWKTQLLHY